MAAAMVQLHWYLAWAMLLAAFVSGAAVGLRFHRTDFWGGYASFPRRIVRLGHVALAALGMLNLLFALSLSQLHVGGPFIRVASVCLVVGSLAMPAVCFLAGWREPLRRLFVVPVAALVLAVVLVLCGGAPT